MQVQRYSYMEREYTAVSRAILLHGAYNGCISVLPSERGSGYYGFVTVRSASSPWFGGRFEFRINVMDSYPFACPAIVFPGKLSHPSLSDGTDMVFDHVYEALHPVSESVLSAALKEIVGLFDLDVGASSPDGASLLKQAAMNDISERSVKIGPADARIVDLLVDRQSEWLLQGSGSMSADQWLESRLFEAIIPQLTAAS